MFYIFNKPATTCHNTTAPSHQPDNYRPALFSINIPMKKNPLFGNLITYPNTARHSEKQIYVLQHKSKNYTYMDKKYTNFCNFRPIFASVKVESQKTP